MPNELIPKPQDDNTLSLSYITSSVDFLPRIKLFGAKSNFVMEDKIPRGHWGIPQSEDDPIDLGESVDVLFIDYRAKAIATKEDPIIENFDPTSDTYKRIKSDAKIKDSGCMHGPEFLIYIPSVGKFATLFCGSWSACKEASKWEPLVRCAVTLKHKMGKTGPHLYEVPVAIPCSTELELPPLEEIEHQRQLFKNPVSRSPELAPDEDGRDR